MNSHYRAQWAKLWVHSMIAAYLLLSRCTVLQDLPLENDDTSSSDIAPDEVQSQEEPIEGHKKDFALECNRPDGGISITQSQDKSSITWPARVNSMYQYRLSNLEKTFSLDGSTNTNALEWFPEQNGWHKLEVWILSEKIVDHDFWVVGHEGRAQATINQLGSYICIQWHHQGSPYFDWEFASMLDPGLVSTGSTDVPYFQTSVIELGSYKFSYTNDIGYTSTLLIMRQFDYKTDRIGTAIEPSGEHFAGRVEFVFDTHPDDTFYQITILTLEGEEIIRSDVTQPSSKIFLEPGQYQWSVIPIRSTLLETISGKPSPWQTFSVVPNADILVSDLDLQLVQNSQRGIFVDPSQIFERDLHFEIHNPPEHGTLWGTGTSALTYEPDANYVGPDQVQYRIHEGDRASRMATTTLHVILPENPSRSYFSPGTGTINYTRGTPEAPIHVGTPLPRAMAVVSGIGEVIDAIGTQGETLWRFQKDNTWASIASCNDVLVFCDADLIYWVDSQTGHLLHTEQYPSKLLFANPTSQGMLIGEWISDEEQSIAMHQPGVGIKWRLPQAFAYPRWAAIHESLVVVADTFNFKLIGVDRENGQVVFSQDVFYPNDVRFLNPQTLLIVEEHADRVWKYDFVLNKRSWIVGAANGLENMDLGFDELVELTHTMRIDPEDPISRSKSWREYAGPQTLYAPNGAIALPEEGFYVADTDNHRVVYVDEQGQVVAEITGFNNPNKIALLMGTNPIPDEICHPERNTIK